MTAADTVVVGAVATLARDGELGWVEAVAIDDGRIVAAGRVDEVEPLVRASTRRIELAPTDVALPGLTDAHVHLLEGALSGERVDLAGVAGLDAALDRVADAARASRDPDDWIEGGGWDASAIGRWPTSGDLERVAPGRRIALWAHDHHALLVSARALAEAGIEEATSDPEGGTIRRVDGRPTGILHEHASRLVTRRIPPPDGARLDAAIERWTRDLLGLGVVAVHDMGPLAPDAALGGAFASVRRLDEAGRLCVRVHAGIREESLDRALAAGLRTGDRLGGGDGRARVGWWKRFADGSLGSRTAFLREPYEGSTDRGIALVDPEELRPTAARAADAGIATAIHAIGDAALDLALAALSGVSASAVAASPRVEHAQLVHDDQLRALAQAGVGLSMQPLHARTDGPSLAAAWGERSRALGYRWRSALRHGVRLAFGSDAPVESPDPWPALAVAIDRTRATLGASADVLDDREELTLGQALHAACVAPPALAGEVDRGRLIAGQRADLMVVPIPRDGRLEDPAVLAMLRPRLVLVDGRTAWEA